MLVSIKEVTNMKYKLITAELETYESDDFNAVYWYYQNCVERRIKAVLYKDNEVFLEYIPERYI